MGEGACVDSIAYLYGGRVHFKLLYKKNNFKDSERWGIGTDEINYQIGKCYFLLHDTINAKIYVKKALEENATNEEAKKLILKL